MKHAGWAVLVTGLVGSSAHGSWRFEGDGTWSRTDHGRLLRQGNHGAETALAIRRIGGSGVAWRCLVEPGAWTGEAGLRIACDADGAGGLELGLGASDGSGIELRNAAGERLWRDRFLTWTFYQPMWLEGVLADGRVRVQILEPDRTSLLAQSDWIELHDGSAGSREPYLALFTRGATARFQGWERAGNALAPYDPNNPTALRLQQEGNTTWETVGGGSWQWRSRAREVLLQTRRTERTTALMTTPAEAEGTWRCRIRLDKGTRGGGMLLHANRDMTGGFIVWLGGKYGDGRLMLYRYPTQCFWASPDGNWRWDTEYLLEATIRNGRISARLLDGNKGTVIVESPAQDLLPEERHRTGMIGFQTWQGTGRFTPFPEATGTGVASQAGQMAGRRPAEGLGTGWRAIEGKWRLDESGKVLRQVATAASGTALFNGLAGAAGSFRCTVVPRGAAAVALLFQVDEELTEGFECRLGQGVQLRTLEGKILWEDTAFPWRRDQRYVLQGIVMTDRIQVRIRDTEGNELSRSVERYVADTNNDRIGVIGFRTQGGRADFSDWARHEP